jgi:hypothetical protein
MTARETAEAVYGCIESGDVEGVMGALGDAMVAIPGGTAISGDHKGADFRAIASQIIDAVTEGRLRRELIAFYDQGPGGTVAVWDNLVPIDGGESKYHTAEEWMSVDGSLVAWMIYVHEYDVFEKAWA